MRRYQKVYVTLFVIPVVILIALMLFCGKTTGGITRDALVNRGWTEGNATKITRWLSNLDAWRPEQLVVLIDCNNTAWAGDIADSMFMAGVEHDFISWGNAPILASYPFDRAGSTPFDYYEYLYDRDAVVAYNYVAQAFTNLTLKDVFEIFTRARDRSDFPKSYEPLKELLNDLSARGITVGFVSAGPIFMVAPMLELGGYDAPLINVEGIDVFVRDPDEDDKEVLLSNLIHTNGLRTWKDVVEKFGHMKITERVSEIISSREGKAVGGSSIAARHVARWNAEHDASEAMTYNQLRLAAVFGDDYGPFSDLRGADPVEKGNDQGLVRALPFIERGGIVVDIYCAIVSSSPDLEKYRYNYETFIDLSQQSKDLANDLDFLVQVGICEGNNMGSFLPLEPK